MERGAAALLITLDKGTITTYHAGGIHPPDNDSLVLKQVKAAETGSWDKIIYALDSIRSINNIPENQQKWTELPPHERHRLLGEMIDAMIYNEQAVTEVRDLLESFRDRGMIKSVILPDVDSTEFN